MLGYFFRTSVSSLGALVSSSDFFPFLAVRGYPDLTHAETRKEVQHIMEATKQRRNEPEERENVNDETDDKEKDKDKENDNDDVDAQWAWLGLLALKQQPSSSAWETLQQEGFRRIRL